MKMVKKPGKVKFLLGILLQVCGVCFFIPMTYMNVWTFYHPQGLGDLSVFVTIPMSFLFFALFFIGRALSRTVRVEFPDQKEMVNE